MKRDAILATETKLANENPGTCKVSRVSLQGTPSKGPNLCDTEGVSSTPSLASEPGRDRFACVGLPPPVVSAQGSHASVVSTVNEELDTTLVTKTDNPKSPPLEVPVPPPVTKDLDAESLAQQLSSARDFSAGSLLALLDRLPRDRGLRSVQGKGGSRFSAGVYFRAGQVCCFRNNSDYPAACKHICAAIRCADPSHTFAAFQVLDEVQSDFHRDLQNLKGSCNLVIPLTRFSGGAVWLEDPSGPVMRHVHGSSLQGRLAQVSSGPLKLQPDVWHRVENWEGRRVIIVAHTPKLDGLSRELQSRVSLLGFVFRVCQVSGPAGALVDLRSLPSSCAPTHPSSLFCIASVRFDP